jgi:hypothetical protein
MQQNVPIGQIVELLLTWTIIGAVFVTIVFALSRYTMEIVGRSLLVIVLFIAALFYVFFAIRAGAGPFWLAVELVEVAIFGGMGLLGLRGSPWWLVAGWALHSPLWDGLLHFFGPGRPFAPINYMLGCFSFDLVVAGYIVIAYGLLGARRQAF